MYNQLILDGVRLCKVYTHLHGNNEFEYDKKTSTNEVTNDNSIT